jgi:hypothetical protein
MPPSLPGVRLNRSQPRRGDWLMLPAAGGDVPALPERGDGRGDWSDRTRRAWASWWKDPASPQWSEADRDLVEHLADVYEEWVRKPRAAMATEIRQLRDSLGLTPKGKQDRRWLVALPEHDVEPRRTPRGMSARERFGHLSVPYIDGVGMPARKETLNG